MAEHAKLMSPSSAHRRIACPGSYVLEAPLPDTSSDASDDGTAMHWVSAECLTSDRDPHSFVGRYIDVHDKGQPVRRVAFTSAMAELAATYVNAVRSRATTGELHVERKVDFSSFVDVPGQFGTLDYSILFEAEKLLEIGDLKSGYRRVNVVENPQLMLYALGEINVRRLLGDEIERVRMVIHQPKVFDEPQEWECSVADLMVFAELARRATHMCKAAEENMRGGGKEFAETYLNPGEEQCTFCKAAGTCPAKRAAVAQAVTFNAKSGTSQDDFDIVDPIGPVEMHAAVVMHAAQALPGCTPDQLGRLLAIAPMVESWIKALRAEGDRRLLAGQVVPGFKVVQGKKGPRQWADPEDAEKQLKAMRLRVEEMYDLKLISPTTAEKLTKSAGDDGKPALGPRQWQKLQALITQSPGSPSVVPETDKRPALQIAPPVDDFEVVDEPAGAEALA